MNPLSWAFSLNRYNCFRIYRPYLRSIKKLFDDVVDFDATDCEDADDTDETEEMKTKPEVKIQLLLNNAMAVTTKGKPKAK